MPTASFWRTSTDPFSGKPGKPRPPLRVEKGTQLDPLCSPPGESCAEIVTGKIESNQMHLRLLCYLKRSENFQEILWLN